MIGCIVKIAADGFTSIVYKWVDNRNRNWKWTQKVILYVWSVSSGSNGWNKDHSICLRDYLNYISMTMFISTNF